MDGGYRDEPRRRDQGERPRRRRDDKGNRDRQRGRERNEKRPRRQPPPLPTREKERGRERNNQNGPPRAPLSEMARAPDRGNGFPKPPAGFTGPGLNKQRFAEDTHYDDGFQQGGYSKANQFIPQSGGMTPPNGVNTPRMPPRITENEQRELYDESLNYEAGNRNHFNDPYDFRGGSPSPSGLGRSQGFLRRFKMPQIPKIKIPFALPSRNRTGANEYNPNMNFTERRDDRAMQEKRYRDNYDYQYEDEGRSPPPKFDEKRGMYTGDEEELPTRFGCTIICYCNLPKPLAKLRKRMFG